MGEFADMAIEEAFDIEDLYESWMAGNIDDSDAFDFGLFEYNAQFCRKKCLTCRYCKESDLGWGMLDGKWRMFSKNGELHACSVRPLPLTEYFFEIVWYDNGKYNSQTYFHSFVTFDQAEHYFDKLKQKHNVCGKMKNLCCFDKKSKYEKHKNDVLSPDEKIDNYDYQYDDGL